MRFTKKQLETKSKPELQQIAREVGAIRPSDQRKRSEWIDAILAATQSNETVSESLRSQEFKPTRIAQPLPQIRLIQVYPRPKQEQNND